MNSPGLLGLLGSGFARFTALTIPRVTVNRNPYGLPKANTVWPGRTSFESPQGALARSEASTFKTARSVRGSVPISFAFNTRRLLVVRSEERRVGKECRSRGGTFHRK